MGESLVTDVMSCARCGFNHDHVAFLKLVRPMSDFQWWAECPITHEPILMKVEDDGQPVDGDSLCAMCGAKFSGPLHANYRHPGKLGDIIRANGQWLHIVKVPEGLMWCGPIGSACVQG